MLKSHQSVVGIYLAAGRSSRMGRNKLTLPLGKDPLGSHALQSALRSKLDHIIVVSGEDDGTIESLKPYFTEKITAVQCPDSHQGLSYSLKFGMQCINNMNVDGAVILLADQPFIHYEMIDELINKFYKEKVDYVASSFNDVIRPPALIGKRLFPLLQELKGDVGAKNLLTGNPNLDGRIIRFGDGKPFFDIDTMKEYEEALKEG